jgi:hypothetical protein
MMQEIFILINGVSLLAMMLASWGSVCSNRTVQQRKTMRNQSILDDQWITLNSMDNVDFKRHMISLMTFRNPWRLYKLVVD